MQKKALEIGVSLHRGPTGNPGGGFITRDFEIWTKVGSGNRASLSLWEPCEGNMEEGILYWRTRRICKGRLWKWASFSIGKHGEGVHLPGTLRESKRALCKCSVSLYGSFVKGTWRESSYTGDSESYIRHVKEGFGNGASNSLYRLHKGNLEGGLLYWGLRESCNGRLWKQSISFIGLHKGNLRYLAREASFNMFIGPKPVLDIFFCHVSLRGLCPYFWPKHSKGYLTLGSGGLNPEGIRKTYPRSYHAFINPLNAELNPICYLLALLGAHHFLHVSRIRVKSLTLRQLMSYIYGAPILDVSRSHTTTHHSR